MTCQAQKDVYSVTTDQVTQTADFVIVDTGCANLSSVKFAVERLGYAIVISDDIKVIKNAKKVILPGVGTARHAMENIKSRGLVATLQQLTQPVLGFCLGMQLMARSSVEGANSDTNGDETNDEVIECLGLIPTDIRPLDAKSLRLPHMGWNTLSQVESHPVFNGINVEDYFYFVHSLSLIHI